ncbi:MAG: hypothetical protein AAGH90_09750 [Pseudomonadota bacterium]
MVYSIAQTHFWNWLCKIAFALCLIGLSVSAAYASDFDNEQSRYASTCETLDAPNIDCQCVGRAFATWAHLSPTSEYRDYLFERYREDVSLGTVDDALMRAVDAAPSGDDFEYAEQQRFGSHYKADPFKHGGVKGCVIPGAESPSYPTFQKGSPFQRAYAVEAANSGWTKVPACRIGVDRETYPLSDYEAYVRRVYERSAYPTYAALGASLGISEKEAERRYLKVLQDGQKREAAGLGPSRRCIARFGAEDLSTGRIRTEWQRSAAERAGTPMGMESIDLNAPLPELESFADMMKRDTEDMQRAFDEMQTVDVDKEVADAKNSAEFKRAEAAANAQASSLTPGEVEAACKKSNKSDAYCGCLTNAYQSEIIPVAGSSSGALAVILVSDGLTPPQIIATQKAVDDDVYLENFQKMMDIGSRCDGEAVTQIKAEPKPKLPETDKTSTTSSPARDRYKAVCMEANDERFCTCAANKAAELLSESEIDMLIQLETSGDDAMGPAAMAFMTNPKFMQSQMALMSCVD